jgi:hypothetical protein
MMALGFSEVEIGALAGVDHTTIAHLLDPYEDRAISQEKALRLKEIVRTAGAERLKALLPRVRIEVLDTCCDKGRSVDEHTRQALAGQIRRTIQNALILSSAPVEMVPGIHGCLALIGEPVHGLYLMGVPFSGPETPEARLEHANLCEHEAEHLLQRFRADRQQLEQQLRVARERTLPSDGSIA